MKLCLSKSLEAAAGEDCTKAELGVFWLAIQAAVRSGASEAINMELGTPTQFGRPNWVKELGSIKKDALAKMNRGKSDEEVCVYVCGNAALTAAVSQACSTLTDPDVDFRLFAEQF